MYNFARQWVVEDYLHRRCGSTAVTLVQRIASVAPNLNLKCWRFRFVFNDELELLKTDIPLSVFPKKRVILINMQHDVYHQDCLKEWALNIVAGFNLPETVGYEELFPPSYVNETMEDLWNRQPLFSEEGMHTIDFVVPFDVTKESKTVADFLELTEASASDKHDLWY